MFSPIALVVGFSTLVFAACAAPAPGPSGFPGSLQKPNVALFNLPATITPPSGESLNAVYVGYGTQNYSCNPATLTYFSTGTAEAKLFDVTSLYTGSTAPTTFPPLSSLNPVVNHFYVPNPNAPTTVVPKFVLCSNGPFLSEVRMLLCRMRCRLTLLQRCCCSISREVWLISW